MGDALIIFIVISVLGWALYLMQNEEQKNLSDRQRRKASGKFVQLREGLVHYEMTDTEAKRTVVLVHGFSTYSFSWEATFPALYDAGFCVVRYDLYGRGYSDRPSLSYDKDLFDGQLLQLLEALRIEAPVDLIGNSMGGLIVTTFAARHPEKVRTLTLIDPAFFFLERVPFPLGIPVIGEYLAHVYVVPSLAQAQTRDFKHPERYSGYDDKYRAQMRYKGFARAILSTIRNLPRWDALFDLGTVCRTALPVLLIWGMDDKTTPLSTCDRVREIAPQAEFHLIEDAAHMPHYERPEEVNPIIIGFLKGH